MDALDLLHRQDAGLVVHEFCQEVHHLKKAVFLGVGNQEVVADLVVLSDPWSIDIVQDEELVPMVLHVLN